MFALCSNRAGRTPRGPHTGLSPGSCVQHHTIRGMEATPAPEGRQAGLTWPLPGQERGPARPGQWCWGWGHILNKSGGCLRAVVPCGPDNPEKDVLGLSEEPLNCMVPVLLARGNTRTSLRSPSG